MTFKLRPGHLLSDFLAVLGEQYQPVRCFEMDVGVVDESLCDPDSRPEGRYRKCKNMDCPARSLTLKRSLTVFLSLSVLVCLETYCTVVLVI